MKIYLKTRTQAAIFQHEIQGQISDGAWENDSRSQWRYWSNADVFVGENDGCIGAPGRRGFALHQLIEYVGERMIQQAQAALAFPELAVDDLHFLDYAGGTAAGLVKWAHGNAYYSDILKRFHQLAVEAGRTGTSHLALAQAGMDIAAERLAAVDYTEKNLKADLTQIKKTMKKDQPRGLVLAKERLAAGAELTEDDRAQLLAALN